MEHLNGHEPLCTYIWLLRSPGVGTVVLNYNETTFKKNGNNSQLNKVHIYTEIKTQKKQSNVKSNQHYQKF